MFGLAGNHGFLVRDATEDGLALLQQFHSREATEDLPQLVITFAPQSSSDIGGPLVGFGGRAADPARLEPAILSALLLLVALATVAVASSSATRRPAYARI
jgi:hypothetical protein